MELIIKICLLYNYDISDIHNRCNLGLCVLLTVK